MRKAFLLFGILVLTALGPATSVAAPATSTDAGIMFGGQWFEANQSGESTVNFSEMPPILEVYTATWCSNCVDVEHALDAIMNETGLQQYHIHRAINEPQDPLGSIELDQRFYDRYGVSPPPVVVFNGSVIKIGSVTEYDSLESEFTELAQENMDISGTSTFTWNSTSDSTGRVTWAIEPLNLTFPAGASLSAYAWIVEDSASFEEGSNGLGDYPHVVRGIIELGEINMTSNPQVTSGSLNITLPPAYDGNDLSIHLIYQFNLPIEVDGPIILGDEECDMNADCAKEEGVREGLPAAPFIASLCVVFGAALVRRD